MSKLWWAKRVSTAVAIALGVLMVAHGPASSEEADAALVIDGVVVFPDADQRAVDDAQLTEALATQIASSDDVRFVEIDVDVIRRELEFGEISIEIAPPSTITVASVFAEERVLGAMTWTAEGSDGAALALSTRGDALTGQVRLGERQWGIAQVDGELHVVFEHSPTEADRGDAARRAPQLPEPVLSPLAEGMARFSEEPVLAEDVFTITTEDPQPIAAAAAPGPITAGAVGATSVIDVMVVYDDTALAFHGSTIAIENLIIANVASSNAGLATSSIDATLNLVHVGHVSYVGSGSSFNDLTRLRNKYDGHMDDVHVTRDAVEADLVTLVSTLVDGFCGRANLLQELPSQDTDDQAFGVVGAGCLTNNTYIHEIGHNLGAAHDDDNTGGLDGVHPYSRGWVDVPNNFVTVMSYGNGANGCSGCTTINQFSSPTELFGGFPTGDIDHANASTLDITRMGVAAYRPDPCPNPANDDYPARVDLGSASQVTASGSNACASIEDLETYFVGDEPVESVWYEWTAPFAGMAQFSTCDVGTNFDTTITVFDDFVFFSGLTALGYNDDAGTSCAVDPQHSQAFVTVTEGQTVRFKVDGDGAANGNFVLTVSIDTTCNGLPGTVYLDRGDTPTNGDDVIIGTDNGEVISAAMGDDTICGGGGNDTINGGPGDDAVFGQAGDDTLFGLDGNDELNGGEGNDFIVGFDGADTIDAGPGLDTVHAGPGNDSVLGGAGIDLLSGGAGNDTIHGGDGDDVIHGLDGSDAMHGDAGNDFITGGSESDLATGGDGDDQIFGLAGGDDLQGEGGNDLLYGGDGADDINGGADDDFAWGNGGNDTIVDPSGENVFNGGGGDDTITGGTGTDTIYGDGAESQAGSDTITGGAGSDNLFGLAGDDTIIADDGEADLLYGGSELLGDLCTTDAGIDNINGCEL